ncbi:MAG: HAD family hydrolase [Thermoactinomyces sp.]
MNREWLKVKEFHQAFSVPAGDKPARLPADRVTKRFAWMKEELDEFASADSVEDQTDAMIDLIYLALGTLVEMGVKPERLFQIVHEANMSKLWADGKVHVRDSDGKVIKPPHWRDPQPRIRQELERQLLEKD